MPFDLRRWLREPLLHFLILGALLFLLFHFVKSRSETKQNEITVTAGTVRTISEGFERVWQRPPTQKELDSLIQDYIKEEIYYREAMTMGLDRDDTIIRRRLRQKMEFLAERFMVRMEALLWHVPMADVAIKVTTAVTLPPPVLPRLQEEQLVQSLDA
jgi:hypothetical protein